jgi:pilus assembly protein CpaF
LRCPQAVKLGVVTRLVVRETLRVYTPSVGDQVLQAAHTTGSALDLLDADVRDAVRRHGVDPQANVPAVRRLAETAVAAHDQRSLTGVVEPVEDPASTIDELVARIAGFGPLQRYLDDPSVEEVWINEPSRVFIARDGRHELTTTILTADQVRDLVERMLKTSRRRVDLSSPFVDAMLPDGHRLHVVLDGISRGFVAVNIRKFVVRATRLSELADLGSLTPQAARFLEASVVAGLNIVVSGGTQAGKTTMLNCLGSAVPGRERIISVEEVFELKFDHPDWVAMQTRQAGLEGTGEIRLRELVKQSLRMRPSRMIVGEVRSEECLDLLLALNAGLPSFRRERNTPMRPMCEGRDYWSRSSISCHESSRVGSLAYQANVPVARSFRRRFAMELFRSRNAERNRHDSGGMRCSSAHRRSCRRRSSVTGPSVATASTIQNVGGVAAISTITASGRRLFVLIVMPRTRSREASAK